MAKQGFKVSSNDPFAYIELASGASSVAMGLDNVDSKFKIQVLPSAGALPTGSVNVTIDPVTNHISLGGVYGTAPTGGVQSVVINASGVLGTEGTPGTVSWSVVTSSQSAVAGHGYICNSAGTLILTLPASGTIGDIIAVTGINNATGWKIAQNANQVIHFGRIDTTVGVTGYLQSSLTRDFVQILCAVAGSSTEWQVIDSIGNITII